MVPLCDMHDCTRSSAQAAREGGWDLSWGDMSALTWPPLCPAGGAVLSILDEMENVFVWEHLQSSEGQSRGAWLGMNFNPKGGYPVRRIWRGRPQAVGERPSTG